MIQRYNNVSLAIGVPGLILQILGNVRGGMLGWLIAAFGTMLLIVGLAFYAKAKGQHPLWGLMGLLSCLGLVVLAILPDRAKTG